MTISALGPSIASLGTTPRASGTGGTSPFAPKYSADEQQFLAYAKMSPMERMRASILKSMNLSEDDLRAMSEADRKKIEQKIKDLIEQQMQKELDKKTKLVDISV